MEQKVPAEVHGHGPGSAIAFKFRVGQNRSIHGPLGCLSQASFMPAE